MKIPIFSLQRSWQLFQKITELLLHERRYIRNPPRNFLLVRTLKKGARFFVLLHIKLSIFI